MVQTLSKPVQITDAYVEKRDDGYFYAVIEYSCGEYDEFGPYPDYNSAKSVVY